MSYNGSWHVVICSSTFATIAGFPFEIPHLKAFSYLLFLPKMENAIWLLIFWIKLPANFRYLRTKINYKICHKEVPLNFDYSLKTYVKSIFEYFSIIPIFQKYVLIHYYLKFYLTYDLRFSKFIDIQEILFKVNEWIHSSQRIFSF